MRVSARAVIINGDNFLVMDRDKFGEKYLSLIGGKLEMNENPNQAVIREVREETSLEVKNPKLIIEEDAGDMYGYHYIYLCEYVGGEPTLNPNSTEYLITQQGKNTYTPKWIKISELEESNLLPKVLKETIIEFIKVGFPSNPVKISAKE